MANRLANATSPYLLQHAHNPVDWYEWGPDTLERAAREDKPLLVSIGYAACHWCHVMERESFEDADTAALMNEHFVCVKVDREERPDVDAIYMDAVQAMTGHGGWPMTMFCAPDGRPLYGGTYFPPEDRHGMPSFRRVLLGVAAAWRDQRDALLDQGAQLAAAIGRMPGGFGGAALDATILRAAFERASAAFDADWGGFGRAPKFPQPMNLEFLLRCARLGFEGADAMLATTLARMATGGIVDQAGGGFHRYSVDAVWLVPHFEKMLYDNAQLLRLYARAALIAESGRGGALGPGLMLWHRTATATAEYLLREMRHADGGFFSSQDADSEGVEGKFYVWSIDEIERVCGADAPAAIAMLGATPEGNWEGTNILWMPHSPAKVAESLGVGIAELDASVRRALAALFAARESRIRPATDDKVLTAWNGMTISALAEAGRAFRRPDWTAAAVAAAEFVLAELRDEHGRIRRAWRDGRTSGPGFLDDYALFATACVDLYETTFDERWLTEARGTAAAMIDLFADDAGGGFFDTGSDAERLIVRPKDVVDNAVPSGNAAAAAVLLRLAALTGDLDLRERAARTLALTAGAMAASPLGFGIGLCVLDDLTAPIREIAIAGDPATDAAAKAFAEVAWSRAWLPRVVAAAAPGTSEVPLLAGRDLVGGAAAAYVCEGFVCALPDTEPSALAARLDGVTSPAGSGSPGS